MKVVLLKDVAGIGRKNEIKQVSDGHALNLLLPRKLAVIATPAAMAHAERLASEAEAERKIQENLLGKNLAALASVKIEIRSKANEQGHLFSGIHREQIAEELKKQQHLELPLASILLEEPLKAIGEYKIEVNVGGKSATFTLIISPLPSSAS